MKKIVLFVSVILILSACGTPQTPAPPIVFATAPAPVSAAILPPVSTPTNIPTTIPPAPTAIPPTPTPTLRPVILTPVEIDTSTYTTCYDFPDEGPAGCVEQEVSRYLVITISRELVGNIYLLDQNGDGAFLVHSEPGKLIFLVQEPEGKHWSLFLEELPREGTEG